MALRTADNMQAMPEKSENKWNEILHRWSGIFGSGSLWFLSSYLRISPFWRLSAAFYMARCVCVRVLFN